MLKNKKSMFMRVWLKMLPEWIKVVDDVNILTNNFYCRGVLWRGLRSFELNWLFKVNV